MSAASVMGTTAPRPPVEKPSEIGEVSGDVIDRLAVEWVGDDVKQERRPCGPYAYLDWEGCTAIWFPVKGIDIVAGCDALKDGKSMGVVCVRWRRWRRTAQKMISAPMMMATTPPITPPTIAPTDTLDPEEVVVVDVGRGPPVASGCT